MKLLDSIKAAANYLAPLIDNDELLEAIDAANTDEVYYDEQNIPCLLAGNVAMVYLLGDDEVEVNGFGESDNETVIPLAIKENLNLVIVYI